jgi:predicted HAD superfamily Cof-like phosphohydrolase
MATSRNKAENFRRDLDTAVSEIRTKYSIDVDDVLVTATVKIEEVVRYSSQRDPEDED